MKNLAKELFFNYIENKISNPTLDDIIAYSIVGLAVFLLALVCMNIIIAKRMKNFHIDYRLDAEELSLKIKYLELLTLHTAKAGGFLLQ